ncbi:CAAD domain-containing protein [Scytonema sp. NUACC26]|uniref:CAAD domain-containing protein n=1 Tax=Scytonema sp. NUACC26 TaxID=3140176 RepID=UPI0034DBE9A3
METDVQQLQPLDDVPDTTSSTPIAAIEGTKPNQPLLPPSVAKSQEKWQEIGEQVSQFLADIPNVIGKFFNQYRQLIVTIVLIAATIVTARVILAILDAINDIPLLIPIFELIGISYTTWFVFRYLLKESTRQELAEQIQSIKNDILGTQNS